MGICALMCVPMAENKLLTQYLKLVANILVCVYKQYFMLIYAFVWCTHKYVHMYTYTYTYICVLSRIPHVYIYLRVRAGAKLGQIIVSSFICQIHLNNTV